MALNAAEMAPAVAARVSAVPMVTGSALAVSQLDDPGPTRKVTMSRMMKNFRRNRASEDIVTLHVNV